MTKDLLTDLAKAKAIFQRRAVLAALGVEPEQCETCGDSDCQGGLPCQTGDGV
jgi:predicted Zn-ribbon and HTH transcriptional regulator